ncbi:diacylglycerol kinase family protein [Bacillus gaemokensis]|uniref:Diacylglycerol kinase n=1 Tax=Bacillus gaemokensis TaxID=574375 RepID=A0A073KI95_9BACI|nr:diacylglycerol kinase family protein [Bacillus gaemokensis]KEK26231.1 diacylglycerol kinase [Bacillus gaemokensis]KYG39038.1 diacylglycerol kinase [Bacillus gaemokensis]
MKKGKLIHSFGYAIAGIYFCLRHERNMKIHFLAAVIVICCGLYFHVTTMEWLILFLTIGIVISLEMVNTAIEKTVDLVTVEFQPFAKIAKDVAAGAVLLFTVIAVIIGAIIFLPYMV